MAARDLPRSDVALIDGFTDHLALERHLSPATVEAYRRDVSQLAGFLRRARRDLPRGTKFNEPKKTSKESRFWLMASEHSTSCLVDRDTLTFSDIVQSLEYLVTHWLLSAATATNLPEESRRK